MRRLCRDRACEPSEVGESRRRRRPCGRPSVEPFVGGTVPEAASAGRDATEQAYRGRTGHRRAHGQRIHAGTRDSLTDGIWASVLDGL